MDDKGVTFSEETKESNPDFKKKWYKLTPDDSGGELTHRDLSCGPQPGDVHAYTDFEDFLQDTRLMQFSVPLQAFNVKTLEDLSGCTDEFMLDKIKMKPAQLLKFRRGLQRGGLSPFMQPQDGVFYIYQAFDGTQGTYDEVLAHLEAVKRERQQSLKNIMRVQGVVRKNKAARVVEQVLAKMRAEAARVAALKAEEAARLYQTPDGFVGTHDEITAHEAERSRKKGEQCIAYLEALLEKEKERKQELQEVLDGKHHVYKSKDGFMGTYAEVADYEKHQQAHEEMLKAVGLDREHGKWVQKKNREKTLKINQDPNDPVVHRIFESDCGSFHGSLEEVTNFEKEKKQTPMA